MPSKYRAVPTVVDGIRFDSKHEASTYQGLKVLERNNFISNLCVDKKQLRYPLIANGILICTYVADFRYIDQGHEIVADAKGMKTPIYRLKKKLMFALKGIEIREL